MSPEESPDHRRRLLIVAEDVRQLDEVAASLRGDGFAVSVATDGALGLEMARAEEPDLIVLDTTLPRMSGLAVCREVRAEQTVPILMLARAEETEAVVTALGFGADDCVTKPVPMRELRARVAALLRRDVLSREARHRRGSGALLVAGELRLDPLRREFRRDDVPVQLRPKEFLLLEYLMRNAGVVMARDRLLEAVWGFGYGGQTRTVDVHVSGLRLKIEEDPPRPRHIRTIRGFGYRFDP